MKTKLVVIGAVQNHNGIAGAGVGRASLADADGPVGYAQQSLLLRDAGARPTEWEGRSRRE